MRSVLSRRELEQERYRRVWGRSVAAIPAASGGRATRTESWRQERPDPSSELGTLLERYVRALLWARESAGVTAGVAGQQVYVVVRNALAGANAIVLEDVQPGCIHCQRKSASDPLRLLHYTRKLIWREIEDRRSVTFHDDQGVAGPKWVPGKERE